jgi:hypothetical protein
MQGLIFAASAKAIYANLYESIGPVVESELCMFVS